MKLIFHKLKREEIYTDDFSEFLSDNELEFSKDGIVVIYGPNGVGKTTLASILNCEKGTEFDLSFGEDRLTSEDSHSIFHVINDQNKRNIIQGSTDDFILGDNIRKEYQLKKEIDDGFDYLFNKVLITKLKSDFGIKAKGSQLIEKIQNPSLSIYISDLANSRSKGKQINREEFINSIQELHHEMDEEYDESKLHFLITDYNKNNSIIRQLYNLVEENVVFDKEFIQVEQCSDAISILHKYYYVDECIVCDNQIDRKSLLKNKQNKQKVFFEKMNTEIRSLSDQINSSLEGGDPFQIKDSVIQSSLNGNVNKIIYLISEFDRYFELLNHLIINLFISCLNEVGLVSRFKEYKKIISEKPKLTGEDILFIEKFISDCIDRKIELQRDIDGNLDLLLGHKQFLNQNRNDLSLSNGEQNFISIAFELLKAKKIDAQIVVIDDPISSFDSIYKNKIIYAILKFLNNKQQILLTHNTDLVSLLEHQKSKSFNLYLLNNTMGERNGFIPVTGKEQNLFIYINKLLDFFRGEVKNFIVDEQKYLIAMIPFMRSFSQIVCKPEIKCELTNIMHGYGEKVVNLTETYNELFACSIIKTPVSVCVDDILGIQFDDWEIINKREYPLLNRTFIHILTYLYLRLIVEKTLIKKFKINTRRCDQLSKIINQAFDGNDQKNIENRVFLFSRKTLLNEFNHFDQDLNLFQPALDITDTALMKERDDILNFLQTL